VVDLLVPSSVCYGEKVGDLRPGEVLGLGDIGVVAAYYFHVWFCRDSDSGIAVNAGNAGDVYAEVATRGGNGSSGYGDWVS
jgi:hypothetical protein